MYEVLGITSAVLFAIVMMPFLLRHFKPDILQREKSYDYQLENEV